MTKFGSRTETRSFLFKKENKIFSHSNQLEVCHAIGICPSDGAYMETDYPWSAAALPMSSWHPLAAFAIPHGLLLVTHGLFQLQKQLMGDQFQCSAYFGRSCVRAIRVDRYILR